MTTNNIPHDKRFNFKQYTDYIVKEKKKTLVYKKLQKKQTSIDHEQQDPSN